MPELPEVQTVVNDLQAIVGKTIVSFWSDFAKAIKSNAFAKKIIGQKITKVFRGGKNIIIVLSSNDAIIVHLKMTGQLLMKISNPKSQIQTNTDTEKYSKHIHHIFHLNNSFSINFSDIRKFGTLELVDEKRLEKIILDKGLDPFSDQYTFENFQELIKKVGNQPASGKNVKQFLMDQSFIAGIGNIYASEIPFDAKIMPMRKISSLSCTEERRLFVSINKILSRAIKLRGTSFSDYRDSAGKKGAFQNFLKVYKQNGQKCKKCDTIIEKNVISQRSTFHCPVCQK